MDESLHADTQLTREITHHIIDAGGKRIRPKLVILTANMFGYQGDDHILYAVVIEMIHSATLLHDDVVDMSNMRRKKPTANTIWGNEASVLVGDFLYSRAFQLMGKLNNNRVHQVLANATNSIAEGEMLQLMNRHHPETDEAMYRKVIACKTATLFSASCQPAAIIAGQSSDIETACYDYGTHLGVAFQLIDDVLDFTSSSEVMGKNAGDDLADGCPTLPLIYAMKTGTPAQKELIQKAIEGGDLENLAPIIEAIHDTKALEYTREQALNEADLARQALTNMPDNEYRQGLLELIDLAISRSS